MTGTGRIASVLARTDCFFLQETVMDADNSCMQYREPNKGKLVVQKTPFKLKEMWAIRIRLQMGNRVRDLALFDLAIDSKLRACDPAALPIT